MAPDPSIDLVRRQPLDSKGVCTRCEKKCDGDYMQCCLCDEMYHALNCGEMKNQVTPTFYKGWDNMHANYPNIQYICDACMQDNKMKQAIIVSNRMCVMEEDMKGIRDEMSDKFSGLENMIRELANKENPVPAETVPVPDEMNEKLNGLENLIREFTNKENHVPANTVPAQAPTYAEAAKSTQSVIVIKKKTNGPSASMDLIYDAAIELNAAVTKAYTNKVGDTVVVCEDEKSKEAMLPVLRNTMENYKVVTPASRLPTVAIIDMTSNYSKENLLQRVKSQNASKFAGVELDENSFKVVFTRAQVKNKNLYKAIVRVSEEVRSAIERAKNKLNIGLSSCPVYDDFFIRRCNRCQCFNHWKEDCPRSSPVVCGKCSGEHDTQSCTSDVIKCANCTKHNYTDTNHEASYYKCRAYVEAQEKLKSTINYYKNNPKN